MVVLAQGTEVVEIGATTVVPGGCMIDLATRGCSAAPGESAVAVAQGDEVTLGVGDRIPGAPGIHDAARGVGDEPSEARARRGRGHKVTNHLG